MNKSGFIAKKVFKIFGISFAGLVSAIGIYLGILYLVGHFRVDVIKPNAMAFDNAEILVSSDPLAETKTYTFRVNPTTPENVTQLDIQLEVVSGGDVISVPQSAKMGQDIAITIKTRTVNENGINVDKPIGGVATVIARTPDNQVQTNNTLTVTVDVPLTQYDLTNNVLSKNNLTVIRGLDLGTKSLLKSVYTTNAMKPIDTAAYVEKTVEYYILDTISGTEISSGVCDFTDASKTKLVAKSEGTVTLTVAVFPTYHLQELAKRNPNWSLSTRLSYMVTSEIIITVIADTIESIEVTSTSLVLDLFELKTAIVNGNKDGAFDMGIKLRKTGGDLSNTALGGVRLEFYNHNNPTQALTNDFDMYNVISDDNLIFDPSILQNDTKIHLRAKSFFESGIRIKISYVNDLQAKLPLPVYIEVQVATTSTQLEFSPLGGELNVVIEGNVGSETNIYDLSSATSVNASATFSKVLYFARAVNHGVVKDAQSEYGYEAAVYDALCIETLGINKYYIRNNERFYLVGFESANGVVNLRQLKAIQSKKGDFQIFAMVVRTQYNGNVISPNGSVGEVVDYSNHEQNVVFSDIGQDGRSLAINTTSGTMGTVRYELINVNMSINASVNGAQIGTEADMGEYKSQISANGASYVYKLREMFTASRPGSLSLEMTEVGGNDALIDIIKDGNYSLKLQVCNADGSLASININEYVTLTGGPKEMTNVDGRIIGYSWTINLLHALPSESMYVTFSLQTNDKTYPNTRLDGYIQDRIQILSQVVTNVEVKTEDGKDILTSVLMSGGKLVSGSINVVLSYSATNQPKYELVTADGVRVEIQNNEDFLKKYIKFIPNYTISSSYSYSNQSSGNGSVAFAEGNVINILKATGSTPGMMTIVIAGSTVSPRISIHVTVDKATSMTGVSHGSIVQVGGQTYEDIGLSSNVSKIALINTSTSIDDYIEANRLDYRYNDNKIVDNVYKMDEFSVSKVQTISNGELVDVDIQTASAFKLEKNVSGNIKMALSMSESIKLSTLYYVTVRAKGYFVDDVMLRFYIHSAIEMTKNVTYTSDETVDGKAADYTVYNSTTWKMYDNAANVDADVTNNTAIDISINGSRDVAVVKNAIRSVSTQIYNTTLSAWEEYNGAGMTTDVASGLVLSFTSNNGAVQKEYYRFIIFFSDGSESDSYIVASVPNYVGVLYGESEKNLYSTQSMDLSHQYAVYSYVGGAYTRYLSYAQRPQDLVVADKIVYYATHAHESSPVVISGSSLTANWVNNTASANVSVKLKISESEIYQIFTNVMTVVVENIYQIKVEYKKSSINAITANKMSDIINVTIINKETNETEPLDVEYVLDDSRWQGVYVDKVGDDWYTYISNNIPSSKQLNLQARTYSGLGRDSLEYITADIILDVKPNLPTYNDEKLPNGGVVKLLDGGKIKVVSGQNVVVMPTVSGSVTSIDLTQYIHQTMTASHRQVSSQGVVSYSAVQLGISLATDDVDPFRFYDNGDRHGVEFNADRLSIRLPVQVQNGIELSLVVQTSFGYEQIFVLPISATVEISTTYPTGDKLYTTVSGVHQYYEPINIKSNGATLPLLTADANMDNIIRAKGIKNTTPVGLKVKYEYDDTQDFDASTYVNISSDGKISFSSTLQQRGMIRFKIYHEDTQAYRYYYVYVTPQADGRYVYDPRYNADGYMDLRLEQDGVIDLSNGVNYIIQDTIGNRPTDRVQYHLLRNESNVGSIVNNGLNVDLRADSNIIIVSIFTEKVFFGLFKIVISPNIVAKVMTEVVERLSIEVNASVLADTTGGVWIPQFTFVNNVVSVSDIVVSESVAQYFTSEMGIWALKPVPNSGVSGSITFELNIGSNIEGVCRYTMPISLSAPKYITQHYEVDSSAMIIIDGMVCERDADGYVRSDMNDAASGLDFDRLVSAGYEKSIEIANVAVLSINGVQYVDQDVSNYFTIIDGIYKFKNASRLINLVFELEAGEVGLSVGYGYKQTVYVKMLPNISSAIYDNGIGATTSKRLVFDKNVRTFGLGNGGVLNVSDLIDTAPIDTSKYIISEITSSAAIDKSVLSNYIWIEGGRIGVANAAKTIDMNLVIRISFGKLGDVVTYYDVLIPLYVTIEANYVVMGKYINCDIKSSPTDYLPEDIANEYVLLGDSIGINLASKNMGEENNYLQSRATSGNTLINADRLVFDNGGYANILDTVIGSGVSIANISKNTLINTLKVDAMQYTDNISIVDGKIIFISTGSIKLRIWNYSGVSIVFNYNILSDAAFDQLVTKSYNGQLFSETNTYQRLNEEDFGTLEAGVNVYKKHKLSDFGSGNMVFSSGDAAQFKQDMINLSQIQLVTNGGGLVDSSDKFRLEWVDNALYLNLDDRTSIAAPEYYRIVLTSRVGVLGTYEYVYSPAVVITKDYGNSEVSREIYGATKGHNIYSWSTYTIGGQRVFVGTDTAVVNGKVYTLSMSVSKEDSNYILLKSDGKFDLLNVPTDKMVKVILSISCEARIVHLEAFDIYIKNPIKIVLAENANATGQNIYLTDFYDLKNASSLTTVEINLKSKINNYIYFELHNVSTGAISTNGMTYALVPNSHSQDILEYLDVSELINGKLVFTSDVLTEKYFTLEVTAGSGYKRSFVFTLRPSVSITTRGVNDYFAGAEGQGVLSGNTISLADAAIDDENIIKAVKYSNNVQNQLEIKSLFGYGDVVQVVGMMYRLYAEDTTLSSIKYNSSESKYWSTIAIVNGGTGQPPSFAIPMVNKTSIVAIRISVPLVGDISVDKLYFIKTNPNVSFNGLSEYSLEFNKGEVSLDNYRINILGHNLPSTNESISITDTSAQSFANIMTGIKGEVTNVKIDGKAVPAEDKLVEVDESKGYITFDRIDGYFLHNSLSFKVTFKVLDGDLIDANDVTMYESAFTIIPNAMTAKNVYNTDTDFGLPFDKVYDVNQILNTVPSDGTTELLEEILPNGTTYAVYRQTSKVDMTDYTYDDTTVVLVCNSPYIAAIDYGVNQYYISANHNVAAAIDLSDYVVTKRITDSGVEVVTNIDAIQYVLKDASSNLQIDASGMLTYMYASNGLYWINVSVTIGEITFSNAIRIQVVNSKV